jgi:hypothetical protein
MDIIHKNDPEFDGSDYVQTQSKKDSKIKFMSISVCVCVFFSLSMFSFALSLLTLSNPHHQAMDKYSLMQAEEIRAQSKRYYQGGYCSNSNSYTPFPYL